MALRFDRQCSMDFLSWRHLLDPDHRLVRLSAALDWEALHERLAPYYSPVGRQAHPVRLLVGLHLLKHLYNMSDERAVAELQENVYWMHFCAVEPDRVSPDVVRQLCPTSLVKFRQRVGADGMAEVEAVIADLLPEVGTRACRNVMTIDATAMPKHIAYPTDSGLLDRGRRKLIRGMERVSGLTGVAVPRTLRRFRRKAQQLRARINKLGKGRADRIREGTLEFARQAGHVLGQAQKVAAAVRRRRTAGTTAATRRAVTELRRTVRQVQRVITQARERFLGRHMAKKLYSYHEPQVVCIRKGQRRGDEYGSKVSLQFDDRGFVRAHRTYFTNRGEATTMGEALRLWDTATGTVPDQVNADRGYVAQPTGRRGRHVSRWCIPRRGKRAGPDENTPWFKKGQRRRAAAEAYISHLKHDHRMNRCYYRGHAGDQMNVILACAASNLKKVVRFELLPAPG